MDLAIFRIEYSDCKLKNNEVEKLRGFFANTFRNVKEMHNHTDLGFNYSYPLVQYKALNNIPIVIGVGEGVTVLKENNVFLEDTLKIGKKKLASESQSISMLTEYFGTTDEMIEYSFETAYIPLNKESFDKYNNSSLLELHKDLESKIIGNIISMSKGLGYQVEERLIVEHKLKPFKFIPVKGTKFMTFKGTFKVNFSIPDGLGLGRHISKGFGVVKRV